VAEQAAERIPVGAPRPASRAAPRRSERVDASGAGLVLLVLIAAASAAGAWLGGRFGVAISGAILGGVLGLPVAFAGVYARYKRL
jgi:hypothetical protein